MDKQRKPQKQSVKQLHKMRRQREAFIDAAFLLFRAKGVSSTSMSEIAHHVGFAEKTIFSYFPTKQLILLAILERYNDDILADLDEYLKITPNDPIEYIVNFIDIHVQYAATFDDIKLWRELESARILINNDKEIDTREFVILNQLNKYYEVLVSYLINLKLIENVPSPTRLAKLIHCTIAFTYNMTLFNAYKNADAAKDDLRELIVDILAPHIVKG